MVGARYAYAPLNGMTSRLVQVCGMAWGGDNRATFLIKYVRSDGKLSKVCNEVLGWFKSTRALSLGRERVRQVDPQGRATKQLVLRIEERVV